MVSNCIWDCSDQIQMALFPSEWPWCCYEEPDDDDWLCHLITQTRIFKLLSFWIKCFFPLIPYPLKILSVVRCNVVSFTNLVLCKNYSLVNSKRMYAKAESVPQRNNNLHNSQSSQFWLETFLHKDFNYSAVFWRLLSLIGEILLNRLNSTFPGVSGENLKT